MISQDLINRGGSKLEITRALLETKADIPIPNSIWKYYGQSLDSIKHEFDLLRKPVIARGSHRNDYHGLIDVVPTKRNINTFSQLEWFIKESEGFMKDNDIKIHCEDWNQPYTPEVHFLIQEQGSDIVGTMMRHPHDKKRLIIQYLDITDKGGAMVSSAGTLENGRLIHVSHLDVTDYEIKELISMYEKLENSTVVDNSFSQQMEFGLRPLMFYQTRPFKKFKPAQDFKIPNSSSSKVIIPHIRACDYFGITPEEGLDLNFFAVEEGDIGCYSWGPKATHGTIIEGSVFDVEKDGWFEGTPLNKLNNYGLILVSKLDETPPIRKRLGNIIAFCSSSLFFNYLFHENYRFMKRADFSFIDFHYNLKRSDRPLQKEDFEVFRESKLFCNGKYGVIIPKKYL